MMFTVPFILFGIFLMLCLLVLVLHRMERHLSFMAQAEAYWIDHPDGGGEPDEAPMKTEAAMDGIIYMRGGGSAHERS